MLSIHVVSDTPAKAAAIGQQLGGVFNLHHLDVNCIREMQPAPYLLLDINFSSGGQLIDVREWLQRKPKGAKVIFAVDKTSHVQETQAKALGATTVIYRPLARRALITALMGGLTLLPSSDPADPIRTSPGVGKAFEALRNIFTSASLSEPLDPVAINSAGEAVMRRMEAHGLASWIDTVRKHHGQTYQHCLIVTGVAVAFAQHLGLSRPDQLRLSFGAMLHDIGKARIPVSILEKPAPLTPQEMMVLSKHPEYGIDALKASRGLNEELLDIVIHHHEYLDGSGYPHGLSGSEISDPVRIITICDVFGALVERRSYKTPLPAETAYQMLLDMGDKLDKDLVREFRFTSQLRLHHAA